MYGIDVVTMSTVLYITTFFKLKNKDPMVPI